MMSKLLCKQPGFHFGASTARAVHILRKAGSCISPRTSTKSTQLQTILALASDAARGSCSTHISLHLPCPRSRRTTTHFVFGVWRASEADCMVCDSAYLVMSIGRLIRREGERRYVYFVRSAAAFSSAIILQTVGGILLSVPAKLDPAESKASCHPFIISSI